MVNQKLYIINLSNLYKIISELKEHIGYEILKFDNNSKKIDQSYSWNIIVDKYEKYFLEILNKK